MLKKKGKDEFEASDISRDLQEHEAAVEDAGRALRKWREQFTGTSHHDPKATAKSTNVTGPPLTPLDEPDEVFDWKAAGV